MFRGFFVFCFLGVKGLFWLGFCCSCCCFVLFLKYHGFICICKQLRENPGCLLHYIRMARYLVCVTCNVFHLRRSTLALLYVP